MRKFFYIVVASSFCGSTWADLAKDMPKRKSGLWEITMKADARAGVMRMQQCVDQKSDDLMRQQSAHQSKMKCTKNTVVKSANQITIESACQMGESTASTKAVFTGDFASAYRGEIHTSFNPPLRGMQESDQTLEAKWLGRCQPGQKPGDVMMPGMGTVNPAEMMKKIPKGAYGH